MDTTAAHVLLQGSESAAKRAFIEVLKTKYGDSKSLSMSWQISPLASWDVALRNAIALQAAPNEICQSDLRGFDAVYANQYFRVISQTLKRYDSNHLYLGTRFAEWTPEAVKACARWCDVISFNVYWRQPAMSPAAAMWASLDKPILIGEFHFGSNDRGPFWPGVVSVPTEYDRGIAYSNYLASAISYPNMVGAHWFEYIDEPLTGRLLDGESGHIGLVAIDDVPWRMFTEAVTRTNTMIMNSFSQSLH